MKTLAAAFALVLAIPLSVDTAYSRGAGGGGSGGGGYHGGGIGGGGFAGGYRGGGNFRGAGYHGGGNFGYVGGGYRGGYGYRGYSGYRGGHGWYGSYRGWYGSGVGLYFGWPWYDWPYAYNRPYYDPYYYPYGYYNSGLNYSNGYYPPDITGPGPVPVGNWYHCDDPAGYYPYVPNCNHEWQLVAAAPPAGEQPFATASTN